MNKEERIKYIADQLIGKGNLQAVEEGFSAGYIANAEGRQYHGHDFIKIYAGQIRTALPDVTVSQIVFLVETDDKIAWQRTLQGTHQSSLMGIPPSKQKVTWNEMVTSRFEGDRIAEEWVVSELAAKLMLKLH